MSAIKGKVRWGELAAPQAAERIAEPARATAMERDGRDRNRLRVLQEGKRPGSGVVPRQRGLWLGTAGRRSFHTPCAGDCPDPDEGRASLLRRGSAGPASIHREILEPGYALSAIRTAMILGSVPEATAPFTNFQLHTQLHYGSPEVRSRPMFLLLVRSGVGGTRAWASGSFVLSGEFQPGSF
jgi:hypothetical protein